MSSWIQALKEHNKGKSGWCMPRKGTDDYFKVKALSDKIKEGKKAPAPVDRPIPPTPAPVNRPIPPTPEKPEMSFNEIMREAKKIVKEKSPKEDRQKLLKEVIPQAIKDLRAGKFTKNEMNYIPSAVARKVKGMSDKKKEYIENFYADMLEKITDKTFPKEPLLYMGSWKDSMNKLTPGYSKLKNKS